MVYCLYPAMRKGKCYASARKQYRKARYRKAFAREMARIRKILTHTDEDGVTWCADSSFRAASRPMNPTPPFVNSTR